MMSDSAELLSMPGGVSRVRGVGSEAAAGCRQRGAGEGGSGQLDFCWVQNSCRTCLSRMCGCLAVLGFRVSISLGAKDAPT
jgi:hypothetical protein